MPNWNDVLNESLRIIKEGKANGWRPLIRHLDKELYHVSRSGLQAAFEREFDINDWDDLVVAANGGLDYAVDDSDDEEGQERIKITHSNISDGQIAYFVDEHFPFHDEPAILLAAKVIRIFAPDEVVNGGDDQDMYAVSSFDKAPDRVLGRIHPQRD